MQNLMPPIDTTDHAFHDGDPTTGQLGTIVTAAWLNDVQGATRDIQAEIIAVLTKAGIQPNPQKQNQLAEAISQIIGSGGYATSGDLTLGLSKKIDKADIAQQLGNDTTKVPSLQLVTTELGKKASVADANSKLAKDKNGADIPDKEAFIGNLGLGEAAKSNVTQATGTSTTNVMSQKSVTDELKKKVDHAKYINDGANLPAEITSQGTGFYRTSATVTGTNIDSQLGYSLFWAINLSGNIGALCVNRLGNLYFSNDCATWERSATLENIKGFASTGDLLGNGQSYVDVTSSRNMNSVYKNTTGRTIFVIVTISRTSGSARADVKIDGVNIGAPVSSVTNGTASNSVCFPIPNGSSYSVSGSGSDVGLTWMELRA
ncbi:hypothetical protein [Morganella morganii]|uniref:hypothetical protein n=1 Tax=Morganella morganii TaxID=582 RepID=UPI001C495E23|nr:hypothetical protein [Morganella morganii]QXO60779.1 hypothetical protein JC826_15025 [Morganella morganii]